MEEELARLLERVLDQYVDLLDCGFLNHAAEELVAETRKTLHIYKTRITPPDPYPNGDCA